MEQSKENDQNKNIEKSSQVISQQYIRLTQNLSGCSGGAGNAQTKIDNIRNVLFCGHGSAGKTTIIDHLLVDTGAVSGTPSVDDETSICDFDPEEKQHKYSIEACVVHCQHAGKRLNLIDTPGYPDFIGQVIGGLQGVDNAAIVINAQSGIEVNTRRVFDEAGKAVCGHLPLYQCVPE